MRKTHKQELDSLIEQHNSDKKSLLEKLEVDKEKVSDLQAHMHHLPVVGLYYSSKKIGCLRTRTRQTNSSRKCLN